MVFIQELSLARTRTRSCILLVDTLNSRIVNRFICYAKEQDLAKGLPKRTRKMTYQKDKENAFSKRTSKMPYQKEQGK